MRKFRKILLVSLCVAAPALVLWLYENMSGKWAWEAYKRDHEARGDSLEWKTFVPPPVADDGNFALTPLLKPIFSDDGTYVEGLAQKLKLPDPTRVFPLSRGRAQGMRMDLDSWYIIFGQEDVLVALQQYNPELREIAAALRSSPDSRFPIAYDKGLQIALPHLRIIPRLATLFEMRASAELRAGKADAALEDTQTLLLLARSMENEPFLISHLVRLRMLEEALQVSWEGLEDHRWTDTQLIALQNALQRGNLLKDLSFTLRGDRAGQDDLAAKQPEAAKMMLDLDFDTMDLVRGNGTNKALEHIPKGLIFYQNLLALNRNVDALLGMIDPVALRFDPARFDRLNDALKSGAGRTVLGIWLPNPYNAMANTEVSVLASVVMKAVYRQVSVDEAVIACALERYRLANGRFPDVLGKLVPDYLKTLPHDIITGGPLHYRVTGAGATGYVLYSVGWNGVDDGGTVATTSDKSLDLRNGDWVWAIGQ